MANASENSWALVSTSTASNIVPVYLPYRWVANAKLEVNNFGSLQGMDWKIRIHVETAWCKEKLLPQNTTQK